MSDSLSLEALRLLTFQNITDSRDLVILCWIKSYLTVPSAELISQFSLMAFYFLGVIFSIFFEVRVSFGQMYTNIQFIQHVLLISCYYSVTDLGNGTKAVFKHTKFLALTEINYILINWSSHNSSAILSFLNMTSIDKHLRYFSITGF